ncbi:hypothetical protein VNI00_008149 [Paramarasmius palmivorus]|uniref:AMP-dependent synthetase/ligase domain-containing protein n=1 Tax=Paramarasmius palmivorus TaxID=297713 RepID=A0AAW0CZ70_9AGAR
MSTSQSPASETFLTNLERACTLYSSLPAFKIPILRELEPSFSSEPTPKTTPDPEILGYTSITFSQFHTDVLSYARYWFRILQDDKIPMGIIGVTYIDVVYFYSLLRAGYIPHLISGALSPRDTIIGDMLHSSGARALIRYQPVDVVAGVPSYALPTHSEVYKQQKDDQELPEVPKPDMNDVSFLLHSTGTSGPPKVNRVTYRMAETILRKVRVLNMPLGKGKGQEVDSWITLSDYAKHTVLPGRFYHGTCTVQQTTPTPSPTEIRAMGLTRGSFFPALLSRYISQPELGMLEVLRGLNGIITGGVNLRREDEELAWESGVNLINVYGNTECGIPMLVGGWRGGAVETRHPRLLACVPELGFAYEFRVQDDSEKDLKELVVLPHSSDNPFGPDEGREFHTGDLFQCVGEEGLWEWKGREIDYIKAFNGCRVDAAAMETQIRTLCSDLISECVVVGTGRPSPTIVVEPLPHTEADMELAKEVFSRISKAEFHLRSPSWGQIAHEGMIIVVPKGSLPRTAIKGNISRMRVEEMEVVKERFNGV